MGLFRRKKQRDAEPDQEQLLREIGARQATLPATNAATVTGHTATVHGQPAITLSTTTTGPGTTGGSGDLSDLLSDAFEMLQKNSSMLAAQGIDPQMIQQALQNATVETRTVTQTFGTHGGMQTFNTQSFGAPSGPAFAPPGAPPLSGAAPAPDDLVQALESLSRLHASGALSAEEFAAAKAKLLGNPRG